MIDNEARIRASARFRQGMTALLAGAGVCLLAALVLDRALFASALLLGAMYSVGICLGAAVFVALHYVTRSGWGTVLRRVPEALMGALPQACGLAIVALLASVLWLYPWAQAHGSDQAGHPAPDPAIAAWWRPVMFFVRAFACMVAWIVVTRAILHQSRAQDLDGELLRTRRAERLSALFIVVFGVTFSLASFEWLMSLTSHWYSTVFGIYSFAGALQSGLAAITLLVLLLSRPGRPLARVVSGEHVHDLGKYLFAFSTFWAYIWFCQYMLIWYTNIPEEAAHYTARQGRGGMVGPLVNFALNWLAPFLMLISARSKRDVRRLGQACAIVLVGRWYDLYQLIVPPSSQFPNLESLVVVIPSVLAGVGLFVVWAGNFRRFAAVPKCDPMLGESLAHRAPFEHVPALI